MPLLYAVNTIWVVEDLFWLTAAVSFEFVFIHTFLERLAGCFSSMCHFRFAVDVDVWSCFLKPGRQSLHKNVRFSHLDHHWSIQKTVLSNQTKMPWWGQSLRYCCCLHLFLPPCFAFWWHMQQCDSVMAGVARLGVFPLHIKACLWCVSARFSPGRKSGTL